MTKVAKVAKGSVKHPPVDNKARGKRGKQLRGGKKSPKPSEIKTKITRPTTWKSHSSILTTLSKEFTPDHLKAIIAWIKRALEKPALTAIYLAIHQHTYFKE